MENNTETDDIVAVASDQSPNATTGNEKEAATTFTCFPKLPIELRLKIWKAACFIPRNVDIWYRNLCNVVRGDRMGTCCAEHDMDCPLYALKTQSQPAVLHTCRESRSEASTHYTLDFGTEFNISPGVELRTDDQILINWEVDRACPVWNINWDINFYEFQYHHIAINLGDLNDDQEWMISSFRAAGSRFSQCHLEEVWIYHQKETAWGLGEFEYAEVDNAYMRTDEGIYLNSILLEINAAFDDIEIRMKETSKTNSRRRERAKRKLQRS